MDNRYFNTHSDNSFIVNIENFLSCGTVDNYCIVAIDIEHFRLFNKLYSVKASDELIYRINSYLAKTADTNNGISGYMGADNFALLIPFDKKLLEIIRDEIIDIINTWSNTVAFHPVIGVYVIDDLSINANIMYDRAVLAITNGHTHDASRILMYSSDIEKNLENEIMLLSQIQEALKNDEFTFFAQPQCNITNGKVVGAEALVRWIRPDGTMISPGVFIPVLENNCMIDQLDQYIWDKVCAWLRSWIDKGYEPVPISINVSRIDILSMDVAGYIASLLKKYKLDESLLKIEITESAYTEQNDTIQSTVKSLRDKGFKVMMDDFGSGYSSLNMLKNIPVDVLKLDMRFLDINDNEQEKGLNILESVINMARLLHLPIVVEGVETQQQEQFVLSLGCRYIQGFYLFKPLPVSKFEELLSDDEQLDHHGLLYKQVEPLHIREFVDSNFVSDNMLNNIIGPVAFYEICGTDVKITRVNDQYSDLVGSKHDDGNNYGTRFWSHVDKDDRIILLNMFEDAYNNPSDGADGYVHYKKSDGTILFLHMRIFFLKEMENKRQFYTSLSDMTNLSDKIYGHLNNIPDTNDNALAVSADELEQYYGNMPFSFCINKIKLNEDGRPVDFDIIYANKNLRKLCNNNLLRLHNIAMYNLNNKNEDIAELMYNTAYNGTPAETVLYSHVSNKYYKFSYYQFKPGYAATIISEITQDYISQQTLKTVIHVYRDVYYINLANNYYNVLYSSAIDVNDEGNYEEAIDRHFFNGQIAQDDETIIRKFLSINNIRNALKNSDTTQLLYKRTSPDGRLEWCMTTFIAATRDSCNECVNAVCIIRNVDDVIQGSQDRRASYIADILSNMSEGFFIYKSDSEDLLFANSGVINMFGCENFNEFNKLTGNNFITMLHPDDVNRVHAEISSQISSSEHNMDYIRYRIIRKDGSIRWVEDYGHLENANALSSSGYYYVFIADITDTITEAQKNQIIRRNKQFNNK